MKRIIVTLILILLIATPAAAATTTTSAQTGTSVTTQASDIASNAAETTKSWFAKLVATLEPWRIKQAAHFAAKRDEVKVRVGIEVSQKAGELVEEKVRNAINPPDLPLAPDQTNPGAEATQSDEEHPLDNPFDYVTLFYSSTFAAMFGNKPVFYISLVLLALITVRFVIRLVF
jgi:hypothetical protein